MKIILSIQLLLIAAYSFAQTSNIEQVNDTLTAHRYEFSALAKWHNKILLVPQDRRNVIDSIYIIASTEIDQSL